VAQRERVEPAETFAAARAERERISQVYARYHATGLPDAQWGESPATRYIRDVKWRVVGELVGPRPGWRAGSWVIDLGAGSRSELADPTIDTRPVMSGVLAVDLLSRCTQALSQQAGVHPVMGHGAFLPVATGSVMVVWQSLMLSSVVDPSMRRHIYAEIARVIAPGGLFVSYDTRYTNPWNPYTRPVALGELRQAFAGWRHRHRTLTGLPPLLRWLAPTSRALCRVVESIPPLRAHRLFVAERPAD
jgi:SAM-dependent methyltransferase